MAEKSQDLQLSPLLFGTPDARLQWYQYHYQDNIMSVIITIFTGNKNAQTKYGMLVY